METAENGDDFLANFKQQGIRKATKHNLTDVCVDLRKRSRKTENTSRGEVYGSNKLDPQPWGSLLVPLPGIQNVKPCLWAELEAQGWLAVTQKFSAERLPRNG
jgi:hypothetical protein